MSGALENLYPGVVVRLNAYTPPDLRLAEMVRHAVSTYDARNALLREAEVRFRKHPEDRSRAGDLALADKIEAALAVRT